MSATAEAARDLLSAILSDGTAIEAAAVQHGDFVDQDLGDLFALICSLPPCSGPIPLSLIGKQIQNKAERQRLVALAAELTQLDVPAVLVPHLSHALTEEAQARRVSAAAQLVAKTPQDPAARRRLAELIEAPIKTEPRSLWPAPVDLKKLSRVEPAPPNFIIPGWLPCGYATLFAGHGGVGKSGIALTLAVCLAMGLPFFGLDVGHKRVMYLSCEDREGVLHWRLSRICAYLGVKLEDLTGGLDVIDLVGHDTILFQPKPNGSALTGPYHQLAGRMKAEEIEVLMIDGISDTYDGNENARAEVKAYVNSILALVPPNDGAAILVGHVSKPFGGNKTPEGYSGSTAWHNSVRARWYLYPEQKRANDEGQAERTGSLLLELQKSNLGPTDGCLKFSWDDDAGLFIGQVEQGPSHFDRNAEKRDEMDGIIAALVACTCPVPAAASGQRTAYHVLSVQPTFPGSLHGTAAGRRRFWKLVEELRAMGLIAEEFITREDRHKTRVIVATAKAKAACEDAGNDVVMHSPHYSRSPLCGHAGNAAGGYKGGPAPADDPVMTLHESDLILEAHA